MKVKKFHDMKQLRASAEQGIVKYALAWFLGVPASLLIVIFILARGC